MQSSKFPPWLVKKHLSRIRNRYVHYVLSKGSEKEKDFIYTWSECCHKAKGKLYYRFNNLEVEGQDNTKEWLNVIDSIKARLVRHFDNDNAWRYKEYRILEKINKQDFFRIESNLIWHRVAVDKAGRANHLWNRRPRFKIRTEKYSWINVLNVSITRIKSYEFLKLSKDEVLWQLCYKANFEKLRMKYRWLFEWDTCIGRNYCKISRY